MKKTVSLEGRAESLREARSVAIFYLFEEPNEIMRTLSGYEYSIAVGIRGLVTGQMATPLYEKHLKRRQ